MMMTQIDDSHFVRNFCLYTILISKIVDKVIWTNETTFKLNGHMNRHNSVYWADENPHGILCKEVNTPGITVWGALTRNGLVGLFDKTVFAKTMRKCSRRNYGLCCAIADDVNELLFQQDGALPHYGLSVQRWLNDHFPSRWIDRRGPIEWPPRLQIFERCH